MGWWVIEDTELLRLLQRAHANEDPDVLLLEAYANADIEPEPESAPGEP